LAADEATCSDCGAPLLGRDRFEGQCAACRERAVLGERLLPGRLQTRPRPARRAPWLLGGLAAAALVLAAALALSPARPRSTPAEPDPPPESEPPPAAAPARPRPAPASETAVAKPAPAGPTQAVRQETQELLTLLAVKDYDRIIENYCRPDEAEFARLEGQIDAILRGEAAAGRRRWIGLVARAGAPPAVRLLRQAGDPDPDFTLAFLSQFAGVADAGSRREPGGEVRRLLRWHLGGLFEGLDLARAHVTRVEDLGQDRFLARIACGGDAAAPRPGDDPRQVRWRRLPAGWVIVLALGDRLEEVRKALQQPIPDGTPATP